MCRVGMPARGSLRTRHGAGARKAPLSQRMLGLVPPSTALPPRLQTPNAGVRTCQEGTSRHLRRQAPSEWIWGVPGESLVPRGGTHGAGAADGALRSQGRPCHMQKTAGQCQDLRLLPVEGRGADPSLPDRGRRQGLALRILLSQFQGPTASRAQRPQPSTPAIHMQAPAHQVLPRPCPSALRRRRLQGTERDTPARSALSCARRHVS